MEIKIEPAQFSDVDKIIALNKRYLIDNLSHDEQVSGYLGKLYSSHELREIIQKSEIVTAHDGDTLVAYYLLGNKNDSGAAIYQRNAALKLLEDNGAVRSDLAYPTQVCIDHRYRGAGLFGELLTVLCSLVSHKYRFLYCSISEQNFASQRAHEKAGWILMNNFESRSFYSLPLTR